MAKIKQRISSFLWFNNQAEEAAKFYTSIFKNSKIERTARYLEGSPGPAGTVMTVDFSLEGQRFTALNGGPVYKINPAISFVVHCENQEEIDFYWNKLTAGGKIIECGWLEDKFGVSWQVVPDILIELLTDKDTEKARRVMMAMLEMKKIDIAGLLRSV